MEGTVKTDQAKPARSGESLITIRLDVSLRESFTLGAVRYEHALERLATE